MTIAAGAVVRSGQRFFLVVQVNGPITLSAPIIPTRSPTKAGDVRLNGRLSALCGSAAIGAVRGEVVDMVTPELLAECRWAASRCTTTAAIVSKYAGAKDWSCMAANERTAVR